jgi:hypothetical protein
VLLNLGIKRVKINYILISSSKECQTPIYVKKESPL